MGVFFDWVSPVFARRVAVVLLLPVAWVVALAVIEGGAEPRAWFGPVAIAGFVLLVAGLFLAVRNRGAAAGSMMSRLSGDVHLAETGTFGARWGGPGIAGGVITVGAANVLLWF